MLRLFSIINIHKHNSTPTKNKYKQDVKYLNVQNKHNENDNNKSEYKLIEDKCKYLNIPIDNEKNENKSDDIKDDDESSSDDYPLFICITIFVLYKFNMVFPDRD